MSTTIHDVANRAGVSIATVSRVLNNSGHPVNDKTRRRILAAAKELGYRPNHAARSLRTDQSHLVGIIADDITSPFSPLIIRGVQDYMHDAGYLCITVNTDWNPRSELGAIRDLVSRSIDGMIFVETWHREANEAVELADKPYVFVHRQFAAAHPNSITPDEVYGARLAVKHLIQLGHRRIGFITGPEEYYASHDRLLGYQNELAEAGIPFDADLVKVADWETSGGYTATQELLQLSSQPTAIFAGNDLMAIGAIYAARDAGLAVPEDLGVVGYDDIQIAAVFRPGIMPGITTVTLPCYEMGQAAAKLLLDQLQGRECDQEEVKIRGRLIVRDSCGARLRESQSR